MTKALICGQCLDILAPYRETKRGWRWCQCGHAGTRWRDPAAGQLDVTSSLGQRAVRVLGLANSYLETAVNTNVGAYGEDINEEWRLLHDLVCEQVPCNYLFHESKRHCWAIVAAYGDTGDINWVDYPEARFP